MERMFHRNGRRSRRAAGTRPALHTALVLATALLAACAGAQSSSPSITPAHTERTMSEMTPEHLAQGVVRLILAVGGRQDLVATQVAAQTGLQVEDEGGHAFSASGTLAGGGGYTLESVADADAAPPSRLDLRFTPAPGAAPAQCTQSLAGYRQALVAAGFVPRWIAPPRPGSAGRWHFERGAVAVYAFVGKDAGEHDAQACVEMLQILVDA
ncbi:hypothetical protein [Xanthomonas sp. CFBP 8445]|uniref:hypothetical protein n=1 Tax=Xanthomonas sp. CFBP 8445 TaxID=2971236 RepID=UPI0021E0057F|nr:hypothetical protein [Xanthomonas sp. CFBP 8445]UYC12131.1 hypothetical protein NUG21_20735 [Xanthomonas sp. CFBP 8445]